MQNKGFVKFVAVLLTLICLFYYSFTFVTSQYHKEAARIEAEQGKDAAREYLYYVYGFDGQFFCADDAALMHQARGIRRSDVLRSRGKMPFHLILAHTYGYGTFLYGKQSSEPAAFVRPFGFHYLDVPNLAEQVSELVEVGYILLGRGAQPCQPYSVAGVV